MDADEARVRLGGEQLTLSSPTPALVRAQVAAVLEKHEDAEVIGISVPAIPDLVDELNVDGQQLDVMSSDSVLAIRELLSGKSPGSPCTVFLTTLDEMDLGADVVARLVLKHLVAIEPWQLVKQRFKARWVDPRLVSRHAWVAAKLLESEPAGGYAPVPSGFLEADTAWRFLFESMLDLPGGRRDPTSLIEWASDPLRRRRLVDLADTERLDLAVAVEDSAGELARRIFDCAADESGASVLSIGLVARALFYENSEDDVEAAKAAGV